MERQPNIQDISWFIDLNRKEQLDLNPSYQRKSIWSLKDQKGFLDSIFRNYPCPSIFIHRHIASDGIPTYHIVDGKQRLETIIQFSNNKISIAKEFGDKNLDGKRFDELSLSSKQIFWNYKLVVENINISDSTNDVFNRLGKISINEVFNRLNSVSKTLNKQELRHAVYNGWFINEAQDEADTPFWTEIGFKTATKSKRMQDVQFVSELLMIIIEKEIVGFDQDHIGDIYALYDDQSAIGDQLDEDEYISEKDRAKKYIVQMAKSRPEIVKWLKRQKDLYILWALITLSGKHLPEPKKLALKYMAFMKEVDTITEKTDPKNLQNQEQKAYTYYSNAYGASADLKPRSERLDALKKYVGQ